MVDDADVGVVGIFGRAEQVEGDAFQALGAGELPLRFHHLVDQEFLVDIAGLILLAESLEDPVEFLLIFVGEDGEGGGQAALGGVGADGGLACFGLGPVLC